MQQLPVVVDSVKRVIHRVGYYQPAAGERKMIHIDGKPVGWIQKGITPQLGEILEVQITLSDGTVHSVYDRSVVVWKNTLLQYCPINLKLYIACSKRVRIEAYGVTLSFGQAAMLRSGDTLIPEQPFRADFAKRVMTNGTVSIPFKRPEGKEWQDFPAIACLRSISRQYWVEMLKAIRGKFLRDILDIASVRMAMTSIRVRDIVTKRSRDVIMAVRRKRCFANANASSIYLGPKFVFRMDVSGLGEIFVVDSPQENVGLYVFASLEEAMDWATGRIRFREARKKALLFLTHRGAWEERLYMSLAA